MSAKAITVDHVKLDRLLREMAGLSGKPLQIVVRDEVRLAMQAAVKILPPKSRQQGEAKIERDLRKVFLPLDEANLFKMRNPDNLFAYLFTLGDGKSVFGRTFEHAINLGTAKQFHREQMRGLGGKMAVATRKMFEPHPDGKNYVANRTIIEKGMFLAYKAEVLRKVGLLKSAWAKALSRLLGNAPSWAIRHDGKSGGFTDMLFAKSSPSMTVWTNAPGNRLFRRALIYAFNGRIRALSSKIRLMSKGVKLRNKA